MALPDEEFRLDKEISPLRRNADGYHAGGEQSITVQIRRKTVRLIFDDFNHSAGILRVAPDDAERLGVLLQYAALEARKNGEIND